MLTAKRHPVNFYLTITLGVIFYIVLGIFMISIFLEMLGNGQVEGKTYLLPLFGVGMFFMALYTPLQYFKNAPKIVVDNTHISFGDQTYRLADIKEIALTGKMPFRYLTMYPIEGASIEFRDGSKKFIYNFLYANAWQIKLFLEQTVVLNQEYKEVARPAIGRSLVRFQNLDEFKGAQWTSFRGVALWGVIGFTIIMVLSKKAIFPVRAWIAFGVFGLFWIAFNSWLMHYFVFTKEYFIAGTIISFGGSIYTQLMILRK
jgi:hypothetical protein